MKKNLFSVLILAFVVINLILNVVLVFSVMPASQKTNKMITQICSILDLELDTSTDGEDTKVPMEDIATYNFEDEMTINLKKGADGKDHFAVIKVAISMNTKDPDYKKYGSGDLSANEQLIKHEISDTVNSYTYEEAQQSMDVIEQKALERIQALYDSKFIIGVSFGERVLQ